MVFEVFFHVCGGSVGRIRNESTTSSNAGRKGIKSCHSALILIGFNIFVVKRISTTVRVDIGKNTSYLRVRRTPRLFLLKFGVTFCLAVRGSSWNNVSRNKASAAPPKLHAEQVSTRLGKRHVSTVYLSGGRVDSKSTRCLRFRRDVWTSDRNQHGFEHDPVSAYVHVTTRQIGDSQFRY